MIAKLRVCASCEWVFKVKDPVENAGCPKCHFGHYSARYVYGQQAYRFFRTQEPWLNKKLEKYQLELMNEITAHQHESFVQGIREILKEGE